MTLVDTLVISMVGTTELAALGAMSVNLILDIIGVKLGYGIVGVALVTIFIDTIFSIWYSTKISI